MQKNDEVLARSATPEIGDRPLAAAADAGTPIARAESGQPDGPWRFEQRDVSSDAKSITLVGYVYARRDGHTYDTEIAVLYGDDARVRVDGPLLAASPDLLAAAQEAWEELAQCRQNDDVDRVMNQLHAAITKASGVK